MSEETTSPPRRRGGQPGNLNGLKHGLYIEGRSVRNTTPMERATLFDLGEIITRTKEYINVLFNEGLKCKTIQEVNLTMHNIAAADIALTRLVGIHNQFTNSTLPSEFIVTKRTTLQHLVDYYKKKLPDDQDLPESELNNGA